MPSPSPLDRATLHARYAAGDRPERVIAEAHDRLRAADDPGIFIHLIPPDEAGARAAALPPFDPVRQPLWGLPVR
jgi:allophanate hydrolase